MKNKTNSDLERYNTKRDLERSPEPKDGQVKINNKRPIFVIQKHNATNLHYDFRLEVDGSLKSWAIPKGPSTDTSEKRLTIPTEDHPLDYANFEGVIPEGHYGAGEVIIWDKGYYKNTTEKNNKKLSMKEAIDDGFITVWLEGQKLKGGYALIRTSQGKNKRWLLTKMKDDKADAGRKPTKTEPKSVIGGKTIEDFKKDNKK